MLSDATTREELEAEVKAALNPGDMALVDQREAVIRDVMHRTKNNNRLFFWRDGRETTIGRIAREATQGRVPDTHELFPEQQLTVLPALRLRMYPNLVSLITPAEPFRPNMNVGMMCMSCGKTQPEKRLNYLDIGVGRIVIELGFCDFCAHALEEGWGPLDWSPTDGPM